MEQETSEFEQRKQDHIRLALDSRSQNLTKSGFEKIQLIHQALPEIDFESVELTTKILGEQFASPHFISSMTAGHKDSLKVNRNLAEAANENSWLMAVGSQRRELTDDNAASEWKHIKDAVPGVKLVSNIGILELISFGPDKVLRLIENLGSIGIYVHCNPLQEAFQAPKSANFTGGLAAIKQLAKMSSVPVIVKEVGFGINKNLCEQLFEIGIYAVDVAGSGGTHWGVIEALRQDPQSIIYNSAQAFTEWGQSTINCLISLEDSVLFSNIWASGGIRSGVDTAKCMALGARAVGVAQPLMIAAQDSSIAVSQVMKKLDFQLKTAMFCTGIKNCEEFLHKKVWHGTRD